MKYIEYKLFLEQNNIFPIDSITRISYYKLNNINKIIFKNQIGGGKKYISNIFQKIKNKNRIEIEYIIIDTIENNYKNIIKLLN